MKLSQFVVIESRIKKFKVMGLTVKKTIVIAQTVLLIIVSGCSQLPLTPSQTAQHFWTAVLNEDIDGAKYFSTKLAGVGVNAYLDDVKQVSISFGEVSIQSGQASIVTNWVYADSTSTPFDTILQKQENVWKVNYLETRKSLDRSRGKKGLSKLVDDLQQYGLHFSDQLDGALNKWENARPELKNDLEELGDTVQKELQNNINKYGPELQQNLQQFSESLDDLLKDLEKNLPDRNLKEEKQKPNSRMI